ncbi:MAG: diaminopimelate epimerase [Magnetococcales bacterium]|nr:diaminopimelate epimerase [Magnetococcales bacterium]
MELPFIKCHGSGNDFILIDEESSPVEEGSRGRLVVGLCHREQGIGADGVLFHQAATGADARMRIFNADGSEARMCGNGIRCLGRYAAEKQSKEQVSIVVMDVVLTVRRVGDFFPGVEGYETQIGPISLDPVTLPMVWPGELVDGWLPPLSSRLRFTALSAPNPHLSARVEEFDREELLRIGRLANGGHPLFPEGVNVSFRRVVREGLFVATYERGVGWTHSCGTAMTASTFAACLEGGFEFGAPVPVFNAGGKVVCTALRGAEGAHSGLLAGNATFEWDGVARIDFAEAHCLRHVRRVEDRDRETRAYDRFRASAS